MAKVLVNKTDTSKKKYTISDIKADPYNVVIKERNSYKGIQLLWKSKVTGKFHFAMFGINGNEMMSMPHGYTRKKSLLDSLHSVDMMVQSFGKVKAHQFFK